MKATQRLHDLGQSLWLDNITRDLLDSRHVEALHRRMVGHRVSRRTRRSSIRRSRTARPTMPRFGKGWRPVSPARICSSTSRWTTSPVPRTCSRAVHARTSGVDGWVSLEVSPLLAYDTKTTTAVAKQLHARAARPNLFIKIPGTTEGLPAIEEATFAGVPINVTLLFSREQYARRGRRVSARHRAAHRGRIERRRRVSGVGVHQPVGRIALSAKCRPRCPPTRSVSRSVNAATRPTAISSRHRVISAC